MRCRHSTRRYDGHPTSATWGARCGKSARRVLRGGTGTSVIDARLVPTHQVHHKSSDTFDKVDGLDFKAGEAIVAVTAYAIAQSETPIAPHLDHQAVGEILKKAKLEELLEHVGVWKP